MATKDLIKKMNSSKAVTPTQIKKPVMPESVQVKVVPVNDKTAEEVIEEQVEEMSEPKTLLANITRRFARLDQGNKNLENKYEAIKDNMEEILVVLDTIYLTLEELKPQPKKPFWKRIFRKCQ